MSLNKKVGKEVRERGRSLAKEPPFPNPQPDRTNCHSSGQIPFPNVVLRIKYPPNAVHLGDILAIYPILILHISGARFIYAVISAAR